MRRRFTERDSTNSGRIRFLTFKSGWIELTVGGIVLLFLLVGNLIAWLFGEFLSREDLDFQPPHWLLLQRMLYQDISNTKLTSLENSDGLDIFFDNFEHDDSNVQNGTRISITSEPVYTAVIGQPYRYQVQASGQFSAVQFALGSASPRGMEIDNNGFVTWTPFEDQIGKQSVQVIALDARGTGAEQEFQVFVAKWFHPLGTMLRGLDLISSLILGTKWTLLPGLIAVSISMFLGLCFGGLAGYYGGRTDALFTYIVSLFGAFPSLVIIFLAAAIFEFNIYPVMAVVGVVWFPRVANSIKAKVLSLKAEEYIEAAKELGLSDAEIFWKEIIWSSCRPLLLTQISYGFAFAILIEITLSYLGFGVKLPDVSWGYMLSVGRNRLWHGEYWLVFFSSVSTILTIIGFYLIADGINRNSRIKGE